MLPELIKVNAGRDWLVSALRNTKVATTGVTAKFWDDTFTKFHSALS